ncbi:sulfatase-like hydrolase/transferase [uncultured Aquimarina sp.]|uniref:sulfatase-like hydrolase/transferase n=1 Tax=uncultured Aquimarina sp. TaxID=575652 RepID=UPI0026328B14|nr:sulfatase-like hydrolase/transferase [uncultured Aquimarina sp.]
MGYTSIGLFIWFESIFYYLYGVTFNPSCIYILVETNLNEASEFISAYLNINIISFSIIIFAIILISYFEIKKWFNDYIFLPDSTKIFRYGSIFSILLASIIFLKITKLITYNVPYLFIKTTVQYHQETKKFDRFRLNTKNHSFYNINRNEIATEETYVFIIGESTTKNKMGLYGYGRNTTPKLDEIIEELFVFENVISPHTYTIKSLTKVLTLSNYENPSKLNDLSIIQLMKASGFKTYWLSNQRPVGLHETRLTKIARGADVQTFINIANYNQKTSYDYQLIKPLKKAINDSVSKKAIFVHLLGTHIDYNKRYPKEFNHFIPSKIHDEKEQIISQYDNAIRYNDFVVRQIIEEVKASNTTSYVLYFADHGEEVYENDDSFGHFEGSATKSMYEIPFILWVSPKYRSLRKPKFNLRNKFMTDELIQAVSDLSEIKFDGFDKNRSIFNEEFSERPRIIQENKNFDEIYKKTSEK